MTLLTASLSSRNAESANTATTVVPSQGAPPLENPSDSSTYSTDVSGASGVALSADLVSQLPSSTTLYVSCFSCLYSVTWALCIIWYISLGDKTLTICTRNLLW